eukprot:4059310-Pyramimonas_sp.AAC.1
MTFYLFIYYQWGGSAGVLREGQVQRRGQLPGVEDPAVPGADGAGHVGGGGARVHHHGEEGLGPPPYQPRVP